MRLPYRHTTSPQRISPPNWHAQPAPADLHYLVRRFFRPAGRTVNIGCGCGRELAWLNANGFPVIGFDPSAGLLAQARTRCPALAFAAAALPDHPSRDRPQRRIAGRPIVNTRTN